MSDFTLDWNTANDNGTTTLSNGPSSVAVTVETPPNRHGDTAEAVGDSSAFGASALQPESGVCKPVTTTIAFDQAVSDLSFEIYDVDSKYCAWDDKVTVIAVNADGDEVPVVFSDLFQHEVTGNSVEGDGRASPGVDGPGAADSVTVDIAGPIVGLTLIFEPGDDAARTGTIGYGDMSFNLAAPALDGYVEGTAGDDLIDLAYTGDPEGDRIDAGDAILPGALPDEDRVLAGAGNDTVYAGLGEDHVWGGSGDDTLYGEQGQDFIYGGTGNDTIIGGTEADHQYGGNDRDTFLGGDAGDFVDGGEGGDDYDTLDLTGSGPLRVIYDTSNPENGTVQFLDTNGGVNGTMRFENIENVVPCFTPGTIIATPKGERLVEELKTGDKIITRDNGIQEIRWIGKKQLDYKNLFTNPHMRPVLIQKGALGNGLPERDMLVSPNHRLLVANDRTALYFEEHEVLVSAKHLVNNRGIHILDTMRTTYVHFMFDQHEVVLSNGAWTESFQPGDYTLQGMGNAQRAEIFTLFPELQTEEGLENYSSARKSLKKHEARLLDHDIRH